MAWQGQPPGDPGGACIICLRLPGGWGLYPVPQCPPDRGTGLPTDLDPCGRGLLMTRPGGRGSISCSLCLQRMLSLPPMLPPAQGQSKENQAHHWHLPTPRLYSPSSGLPSSAPHHWCHLHTHLA